VTRGTRRGRRRSFRGREGTEERLFFFEKKKQKTFACWRALRRQSVQKDKSFLVLFFKKEPLSFFLAHLTRIRRLSGRHRLGCQIAATPPNKKRAASCDAALSTRTGWLDFRTAPSR
jgi:hypothetical protein